MENNNIQYYMTLFELEKDFKITDLNNSYRILVNVWHPDRFEHNQELKIKAEEKIKIINVGYQVLSKYFKNKEEKINDYNNKPYYDNNSSNIYNDRRTESNPFDSNQKSQLRNAIVNFIKRDDDILFTIIVTTIIFFFFYSSLDTGDSIIEDIIGGTMIYALFFFVVRALVNKM